MTARRVLAIDRGGTFTDVVCIDDDGISTAKVLSEDASHSSDGAVVAARTFGGPHDEVRLGTTVATNALLTGSGVLTALVLTRGHGDLPILGDQTRPRLFELDIGRPACIASHVIEATERIAVDGTIVTPLDEDLLASDLWRVRSQGCCAVAICLMHGWRHTAHETRAADIAREIGFDEVVTSSSSPLEGIMARHSTAAVDASLTPILRSAIDDLTSEVGEADLACMHSGGGLVEAARLRGCGAILSGPAGGVLGAVHEAHAHGLNRIIAMDMGGTSTDVAWAGGDLKRRTDTEIAHVRICTPMLDIHTVASGGGSVCSARGGRLRVGPESAGADPGPACYRRGGPATVTDCHVALGRLPSSALPDVFGDDGSLPIDVKASTEAIADMADAAGPERCAQGLLAVAVQRIASAIRLVSVEQGHDPSTAALVAFGGAGGQIACAVADQLAIDTVLAPPRAGVLSAVGIATASHRVVQRRTVGVPLNEEGLSQARTVIEQVRAESEASLTGAVDQCTVQVHVRSQGWNRSLPVPLDAVTAMDDCFRTRSMEQLGYEPSGTLIIDAIEVEVSARAMERLPGVEAGSAGPETTTHAWFDGVWRDVPLVHVAGLATQDGPAIVLDDSSTIVVEPGWRATRTSRGGVRLDRVQPTRPDEIDVADEAMIEVFNHRFLSICREMGLTLAHTASSVNIKERRDYSCAIFDRHGHLVANGPHMPVHLGSMGDAVRHVLQQAGGRLEPASAWVLNDPASGGTHLPDLTVVSPVPGHAGLVVASRGHHADIGGRTPGSMPPDSTSLAEEGVVLGATMFVRGGLLLEDDIRACLAAGPWPARRPDMVLDDLRAQLAANARGAALLGRLEDEIGAQRLDAAMQAVRANAATCVREALRPFAGGRFEVVMDDGGTIRVEIARGDDGRLVIDFTGSDRQRPGNTNAPEAVTRAAVLYVLRCLVADDIPLNDGCFDAVDLRIAPRSMLSPDARSAVVGGNVETSQAVVDAVLGALGVQAGSQGTMNNLTYGTPAFQYYETICGGVGAGPGFDGASGVHVHMTNSRLTDPEVLEGRLPVRVERFALRRGSGGVGRRAGGDGVVRTVAFLEPVTVSLLSNRRCVPPHGLEGGGAGKPGQQRLEHADGRVVELPGRFTIEVEAGARLTIETPGGGGVGSVDDLPPTNSRALPEERSAGSCQSGSTDQQPPK